MAVRHVFLFLLPLLLFSAPLDFKSCQLKYQVSSIDLGYTQAVAVDDEYAVYYSKEKPSQVVVKRDPFLGLNLIKSPQRFRHIFKFYNNKPEELAGVFEARNGARQGDQNKLRHLVVEGVLGLLDDHAPVAQPLALGRFHIHGFASH